MHEKNRLLEFTHMKYTENTENVCFFSNRKKETSMWSF